MRKILLSFSIFFAAVSGAKAQEVSIDSVTGKFGGVFSADDGMLYYTYYVTPKKDDKDSLNVIFQSYNRDLKFLQKCVVKISKNQEIIDLAMGMNNYILLLQDINKKSITKVAFDADGRNIRRMPLSNISADNFKKEFRPRVFRAMPDGFITVTPLTGKKGGYYLDRFNRDFNTKWTKNYVPDNGQCTVMYAASVMDRFAIVINTTEDGKQTFRLNTYQIDQGDLLSQNTMDEGTDHGIPTFFKSTDITNGTGGLYYEQGIESKKSKGVFFKLFGPAGDIRKTTILPWDSIAAKSLDRIVTDAVEGKVNLVVTELAGTGENYWGVAETYTLKPKANGELDLNVLDFIFFKFDVEGNLLSIESLPKEHEHFTIKDNISGLSLSEQQRLIYSKRLFATQPVQQMGVESIIYRMPKDGIQRYYFLNPKRESPKDVKINFADIERFPEKKTTEPVYDLLDNTLPGTVAVPGAAGTMMLYQYQPNKSRLTIWMQPILK